MTSKAFELTNGRYQGPAYENAYFASGGAQPARAVEQWRKSPSHNALMAETGPWRGADWLAMGVALEGRYVVLWFGRDADPQGSAALCVGGEGPGTVERADGGLDGAIGLDLATVAEVTASAEPGSGLRP
jgi:hypothetical protein